MVRSAHVKRVYSSNQRNWVDVLRIDGIDTSDSDVAHVHEQGQVVTLRWHDDQGEGQGANRVYEEVTVDPNSGSLTLPAAPVTLETPKYMEVNISGQRQGWHFKNDPSNSTRGVTVRRVYSRDLAPGVDPSQPVPWDVYLPALQAASVDTGAYVDFAFVDRFKRNNSGQGDYFNLKNADLEQVFADSPTSPGSAVWLNPFEAIVNVKWDEVPPTVQTAWYAFANYGIYHEDGNPDALNYRTAGLYYCFKYLDNFTLEAAPIGQALAPVDSLSVGPWVVADGSADIAAGPLGNFSAGTIYNTVTGPGPSISGLTVVIPVGGPVASLPQDWYGMGAKEFLWSPGFTQVGQMVVDIGSLAPTRIFEGYTFVATSISDLTPPSGFDPYYGFIVNYTRSDLVGP